MKCMDKHVTSELNENDLLSCLKEERREKREERREKGEGRRERRGHKKSPSY